MIYSGEIVRRTLFVF